MSNGQKSEEARSIACLRVLKSEEARASVPPRHRRLCDLMISSIHNHDKKLHYINNELLKTNNKYYPYVQLMNKF
jgi:hypothetical protein